MRKFVPGLAAVAVMAGLVGLFYRGVLTDGLILGDYDAFVYFYPLRQYAAEALKAGRVPLWNPYLFLGAPFFANIQTAVLYPFNLIFTLLPVPRAFAFSVAGHILLAGVSMYLLSRRSFGVSTLPALVASIAFMFSGFLSGQAGHVNQVNVAAWLPMLLLAYDEALFRRSLALGIATGLIGALQLLAGHTQEWYFSTATLGFFALWRIVSPREDSRGDLYPGSEPAPAPLPGSGAGSPRRPMAVPLVELSSYKSEASKSELPPPGGRALARILRAGAFLAVAAVVEAGTAAVQVFPTLELSHESIRGGGMPSWEAVSFSLPPTTALYTLLPTYPATLFSEYVGYVGVVCLVLAALAVLRWSARPATLFLVGLALFGLFMALGGYNPVYPYLLKLIPGLDLFRVPARWLFVYTFAVCALSGLGAQLVLDRGARQGVERQQSREKQHRVSPVRAIVAALVIGLVLAVLAILSLIAEPKPAFEDFRDWALLAAAAAALAGLGAANRRAGPVCLALLAALLVGELWLAGGSAVYRHPIPSNAFQPQRTSTTFILEDAARRVIPERLLSFATNDYEVKETPDYKKEYGWMDQDAMHMYLTAIKLSEGMAPNIPLEYGIQTVDGYDGGVLPLKRYAELKSGFLPDVAADNQIRSHLDYLPPEQWLDLMNVRYVLGTKLQDAQVDNVYYDRGITVPLEPGESLSLHNMPDLMTTSIGIISSTEGARELKDGVPAGMVTVTDVSGVTYQLPIRMGVETGETPERDNRLPAASHKKPRAIPAWSPDINDTNYYTKISLPARVKIKEISLKNGFPEANAKIRFRAVTLIDDVAAMSSALVLSDRLDRELFFDMKLYRVRDPLPRAFVVSSSVVRNDEAAVEAVRTDQLDLRKTVILAPSATARTVYPSQAVPDELGQARIQSYRPEEISVGVTARRDGFLVLLDAFYPGWTAEVDGRQVPIDRADYLFRAVPVPAGEHTVVFRYDPPSFRTGWMISLASVAFLGTALLLLWVRHRRRAGAGVL